MQDYADRPYYKRNNVVELYGKIDTNIVYDHTIIANGKKIYKTHMFLLRDGEWKDIISLKIPEDILPEINLKARYQWATVKGCLYTHDIIDNNNKRHLFMCVSVNYIELFDENYSNISINFFHFEGTICREPFLTVKYWEGSYKECYKFIIRIKQGNYKNFYCPIIICSTDPKIKALLRAGNCICLEGQMHTRPYFQYNENVYRLTNEVYVKKSDFKKLN